jgi:hypothetical protein
MNAIRLVAIVLLVCGLLAFVVPVPHREDHSVKLGGAKIGVETDDSQKLPPAVGVVLLAGGVLALVLGGRKT